MYFNHAFKKNFVATFGNQGGDGSHSAVAGGILAESGVHVSELKNGSAPYTLGVGVTGFFDKKTNLSVLGADIAGSCCPFYLASTALKLNDKQGPFAGGYQESNKSKIINPKYIRNLYKVSGNVGSQSILEIGGTANNGTLGAILTVTLGAVVGTGYVTAVGVPTTGGTGTGATVDITAVGGDVTVVTINDPGIGYTAADILTIVQGGGASDDETFTADTVDEENECLSEFLCGETYYLRIDIKGTPALRFAAHNLYTRLDASGGCCDDPSQPVAVDPTIIYLQWATQLSEDPIFQSFVMAVLVVDGQSYAYNAEQAVILGLDPTLFLYSDAPTTSTTAGIILIGAYVDTAFGDCTFQTCDYYGIEPIQMFASEVDLNGDPCTFAGVCVIERCPGIQANGTGEQKVRELILSESYLQNFTANDLRIREITQGTRIYEVISRSAIYSSFYILHSVPRFNNPTGVFDNDQYLLEVIGDDDTLDFLTTQFEAIIDAGCITCEEIEDHTALVTCDFEIPVVTP